MLGTFAYLITRLLLTLPLTALCLMLLVIMVQHMMLLGRHLILLKLTSLLYGISHTTRPDRMSQRTSEEIIFPLPSLQRPRLSMYGTAC